MICLYCQNGDHFQAGSGECHCGCHGKSEALGEFVKRIPAIEILPEDLKGVPVLRQGDADSFIPEAVAKHLRREQEFMQDASGKSGLRLVPCCPKPRFVPKKLDWFGLFLCVLVVGGLLCGLIWLLFPSFGR